MADVPAEMLAPASTPLLPERAPPPTDQVGPGDVLNINIYETGVALFSGGGAGADTAAQAAATGVQVQNLPAVRVDDRGNIAIPYIGKLHVMGRTLREVEAMIRNGMRRMSQNPRVQITLSEAITNSVIVGGEVVRPGRLVLQTNRETLSDVIALAGGYRGNAKDLTLRVFRGDTSADVRVDELAGNPRLDVRACPGDRVTLISDPHTFSVLGASGKVQQIPFSRSSMSLAEALANAGGVHPQTGDPAAIFLFRYVKDEQGRDIPKVYHINMMQAGSYFLSQRFAMQDKDVLYFGNAASNRPRELAQLVSQVFTPLMTVTNAIRIMQNY